MHRNAAIPATNLIFSWNQWVDADMARCARGPPRPDLLPHDWDI